MRELIEKLEAATAGSEELDAEITAFLHDAIVRRYPPSDDYGPKDRWQFWSKDGKHFLGNEGRFKVHPLTRSLDAIVALVEQKGLCWLKKSEHVFTVYRKPDDPKEWAVHHDAAGPTPAAALCLALLRALEAP